MLINTTANKYVYNDINPYVAEIFQGLVTQPSERSICKIENIIDEYKLNKTNKEGFEKLRDDYNGGKNDWITLYTLMCYSFNYQFRFNNQHQYNSSFGVNRSQFSDRQRKEIKDIRKNIRDRRVSFATNSYFEILEAVLSSIGSKDLVYIDPPYFGSTGNYNDGKRGFEGWNKNHEQELLETLDRFNDKGIRFALSNNLKCDNPYLSKYIKESSYLRIHYLNANYSNCNHQKKDRGEDIEVLITNY